MKAEPALPDALPDGVVLPDRNAASHAGRTAPGSPLRDPQALCRLGWLLVAVVVLWPMLVLAEFKPAQLFASGNLKVMGSFLADFLPPSVEPEFLSLLLRATIETLAMATAGMFLSFLIAVPASIAMTRSLSISRIGPGPGRHLGNAGRALVRTALTVLRAIPEVVWALVFVRVLGLGAAAGVLAIAITYGGMLGKVYAEILESADRRPSRALLEAGSSRIDALLYGLLPGTSQELASYTVYRWECAVRASVVMGFVGAGGLGQLMDQSMKMLNGGEASSILLTFLALVLLADLLSRLIRRLLA
ncbi:ABC transporter permease [soil metagenome]